MSGAAHEIVQFGDAVRAVYHELIAGPDSRLVRGGELWNQFETVVARCTEEPGLDPRQLTEKVNELAVGKAMLEDETLPERIEYEPQLGDLGRIDFVHFGLRSNTYVEVKTVHPRMDEPDAAWESYERRRGLHPDNVHYDVDGELGAAVYNADFASRSAFLRYSMSFEERLAAAREVKAGPGILAFCGNGFAWRLDSLEDFVDFYRTGYHRQDDAFREMEAHYLADNGITLLRNIDHFAFLRRAVETPERQELHFPVRGPRFAGPVEA